MTPGYGTYAFHIASPVDLLDPNVILGLFTWTDQPDFNHREIDFEAGRWANPSDYVNSQFVVQPYYLPSHLVRFLIPTTNSVPSFNWQTNAIAFQCTTGNSTVVAVPTNALLNAGFEFGTGASATNWTPFNFVFRTATNETFSEYTALSGAYSLKMFGPFNASLDASGAYQNMAGASAGQTWRFTGFALNWSGDPMTNTTGYGRSAAHLSECLQQRNPNLRVTALRLDHSAGYVAVFPSDRNRARRNRYRAMPVVALGKLASPAPLGGRSGRRHGLEHE